MAFIQGKYTTDFGRIISPKVLNQTMEAMSEKPFILYRPSLISDEKKIKVTSHINKEIKELQKHNCLYKVYTGLDGATEQEYKTVKRRHKSIPGSVVINNNDPDLKELLHNLEEKEGIPIIPGKGLNFWLFMGYRNIISKSSYVVTHDSDILPAHYSKEKILQLVTPLVKSGKKYDISKAYYERIRADKNELAGRVSRLLLRPLIYALQENFRDNESMVPYLDFLLEIKYPLSGEMAMSPKVANILQIQPDWGKEIDELGFFHEQGYKIAQIDWETYDHKHSKEFPKDPTKGLHKMGTDIVKAMLRKIHSNEIGAKIDEETFKNILFNFGEFSEAAREQYEDISLTKTLVYDEETETKRTSLFRNCIKEGYEAFKNDPEQIPTLPPWRTIDSKYKRELEKIIQKQLES